MRNIQNVMQGVDMLYKLEIKLVKNDAQYRAYLAEIERLAGSDPEPESPEGSRLELLAKLVEDYEKQRFEFSHPDPIDVIRFRMEQQGLKQKDIAPILGGKNRASEVLARKRPLSLNMIRALHEQLHIPADLLISDVSTQKKKDTRILIQKKFRTTL